MEETIHIIFDGPPGPKANGFVEVENSEGKSINAGEWKKRDGGYWALVISSDSFEEVQLLRKEKKSLEEQLEAAWNEDEAYLAQDIAHWLETNTYKGVSCAGIEFLKRLLADYRQGLKNAAERKNIPARPVT